MTKLILDLRNNPGGYVSSAQQIADEFLEEDKLVLITRNKNGEESRTYATDNGDFEEGRIYVLINENSASASEIVAGALQDNDKGVIVGRRSFGKGLVQREMSLGDGSAVRLTIARYYTPTGRSIQRPYGEGNSAYYREYEDRYRNGELRSADSIKVADSLRFITPGGKVVYGGGGIIPDIFVPKDTSIENETLAYVTRSGFMSYFIFEHLEEDRSLYEAMTLEEFVRDFEVSDELADEFIAYSRFEDARIDISEYYQELKQALKANIAQQLFDSNAYERILNQNDEMILKVLQLDSGQGASTADY
jgi:carboxyl-terminal processing protease